MYNVTTEMIEQLKANLDSKGIDTTEVTDSQLAGIISQASTLIGDEYINPRNTVDYDYEFKGDLYITAEYPIQTSEFTAYIDDKDITEEVKFITNEGVIHFNKEYEGILKIGYTVGLSEDVVQEYVLLTAMYLYSDSTPSGSLASITEGDVSISYNTGGSTLNSLDSVVNDFHNKFGARVKLL